jgi:hypothetical protein
MDIVIAKFKEDVSWSEQLSEHNIIVYNKDPEDKRWDNNLTNYGKDAETHLYHIINNYDNLADYTAFLQGNPFDHWFDTIKHINRFKKDLSFLPLGPVYKRDIQEYEDYCVELCKKFNIEYEVPFYFIGGMQIILSKEQIHKRSKQFYISLHKSMPKVISRGSSSYGNSNFIWWLEYTWPTIFGINKEIQMYKI